MSIDPFTLGDEEFLARARGMCATKAIYVNREQATAHLRRGHKGHGYNGHIYKCPLCGYYHTTSYDKRRSRCFSKRVSRILRSINS